MNFKRRLLLCLILLMSISLLVACSGGNASDNNKEQQGTEASSNKGNPNWTDDIPKEIPIYPGDNNVSTRKLGDSLVVSIACDNTDDFNKYIQKLEDENWQEEFKASDYQYYFSKNDYFLNVIHSSNKKKLSIEISSGDTAQFLKENINNLKNKNSGSAGSSSKGYKISKSVKIEISDDQYLEDSKKILAEFRAIAKEMMENLDKASSSQNKRNDLQVKIEHFQELVEKNQKIIDSGGYTNRLTYEMFPVEEQPSRCKKSMNSLNDSLNSLLNDYNTAYKYS